MRRSYWSRSGEGRKKNGPINTWECAFALSERSNKIITQVDGERVSLIIKPDVHRCVNSSSSKIQIYCICHAVVYSDGRGSPFVERIMIQYHCDTSSMWLLSYCILWESRMFLEHSADWKLKQTPSPGSKATSVSVFFFLKHLLFCVRSHHFHPGKFVCKVFVSRLVRH